MGASDVAGTTVSPEEIERRIAEYRRVSFLRQAPAQVVYHGAAAVCPWQGCGQVIGGVLFRLEQMGEGALYARYMDSWWNGPGLIGKCPRCQQLVLFGLVNKQAVSDPAATSAAVLPETWARTAHLVTKAG
jgi:hypothetical protein